jgi:hypothetical protein
MWIVLTLAVYGVLSCAGVGPPTWLIVVDVVITAPLVVLAIAAVGARPEAARSDPGLDVGACKARLQGAGWVAGEEVVTTSDGQRRCRVAVTKDARTVTGEGEDVTEAWREAVRLAEAEDQGGKGA